MTGGIISNTVTKHLGNSMKTLCIQTLLRSTQIVSETFKDYSDVHTKTQIKWDSVKKLLPKSQAKLIVRSNVDITLS